MQRLLAGDGWRQLKEVALLHLDLSFLVKQGAEDVAVVADRCF